MNIRYKTKRIVSVFSLIRSYKLIKELQKSNNPYKILDRLICSFRGL